MNNEAECFFLGGFFGMVLSALLCIHIQSYITYEFKKDAIKKGVAEYDKETGKWHLKNLNKVLTDGDSGVEYNHDKN